MLYIDDIKSSKINPTVFFTHVRGIFPFSKSYSPIVLQVEDSKAGEPSSRWSGEEEEKGVKKELGRKRERRTLGFHSTTQKCNDTILWW